MENDIVLERVAKGMCPVCNKPLDQKAKDEGDKIVFTEYKGTSQLVHQKHLKITNEI